MSLHGFGRVSEHAASATIHDGEIYARRVAKPAMPYIMMAVSGALKGARMCVARNPAFGVSIRGAAPASASRIYVESRYHFDTGIPV